MSKPRLTAVEEFRRLMDHFEAKHGIKITENVFPGMESMFVAGFTACFNQVMEAANLPDDEAASRIEDMNKELAALSAAAKIQVRLLEATTGIHRGPGKN